MHPNFSDKKRGTSIGKYTLFFSELAKLQEKIGGQALLGSGEKYQKQPNRGKNRIQKDGEAEVPTMKMQISNEYIFL